MSEKNLYALRNAWRLAMQREQDAFDFYSKMTCEATETGLKAFFAELAQQEAEHKDHKMTPEQLKKVRSKARALEPMVRIGKNGLTDNAVLQAKRLLQKRKLIKVKFLRSFLENHDRKKAAAELAKKTSSELVEQVGFVAVLYKR